MISKFKQVIFNQNISENTLTRLNWLDWMKFIGIFLIVYGHFFSLYDIYVYVFSVPLFFLISGFLCKKETNERVFWRKLWYNLILPLLIICTLNYCIGGATGILSSEHILPENPLFFLSKMLIGIHGSVGALWFVYTLIILKIIFQYTKKWYIHMGLFVGFMVLAYIINNYEFQIKGCNVFKIPWSIPNTFVSYPFFIMGYYLSMWKEKIINYKCNKYTLIWIVLSLFIVFLCGHNNKYVFMYSCGYGDNMVLFLVGGVSGSILIFLISKILDGLQYGFITTISNGTIIILGLHGHFITICRNFIKHPTFAECICSIFIVLAFVSIIRICELYIPLIIGKYRLKKI